MTAKIIPFPIQASEEMYSDGVVALDDIQVWQEVCSPVIFDAETGTITYHNVPLRENWAEIYRANPNVTPIAEKSDGALTKLRKIFNYLDKHHGQLIGDE